MPQVVLSTDDAKRNETAFFLQQVDDLWRRWQSARTAIASEPQRYLIMSTPRTGSTMLSRRLNGSSRAGYVHEWLNWEFMSHFAGRCPGGRISLAEYVNVIDRATSTANGVVGINVHVHQYRFLLKKGFDIFSLGFARIYWLERADRVAQAYSWAKAYKSKCWSSEMERALGFSDGLTLDVSPHETARFLAAVCDDTEFFRTHVAPKHPIHREFVYEAIAADGCGSAVDGILSDFGLKAEGSRPRTADPDTPTIAQSSDFDRQRIAATKRYFGLADDSLGTQNPVVR
jgi:LPS sulfotransferase NodH